MSVVLHGGYAFCLECSAAEGREHEGERRARDGAVLAHRCSRVGTIVSKDQIKRRPRPAPRALSIRRSVPLPPTATREDGARDELLELEPWGAHDAFDPFGGAPNG